MKNARIMDIILHLFVGVGAMAGGLAAILDPLSPMDMPIEVLQNSPFNSFLIPGLFLFIGIGICNLISGIIVITRLRFNEYLAGVTGVIMALWLVIQVLMLRGIHFLHVIFFVIALIQGIIAIYRLYNRNLFPFNF